MADESSQTEQVARAFNVVEVPTFIFMRSGKEVARHVGSSRGDLIGKILQVGVLTAAIMHAVRCVLERALLQDGRLPAHASVPQGAGHSIVGQLCCEQCSLAAAGRPRRNTVSRTSLCKDEGLT
jgi:hypothetical protein